MEADDEVEKIIAAYPTDRLRGKAACIAQIEEAVKEGIAPDDLLQAVQTYATDSAAFTRSKVCFSDNWFQSRRWQAYVEKQAEDREKAATLAADHHARLACWISDRSPMCKHITGTQVTALLASKLVSEAQIKAAGLRLWPQQIPPKSKQQGDPCHTLALLTRDLARGGTPPLRTPPAREKPTPKSR